MAVVSADEFNAYKIDMERRLGQLESMFGGRLNALEEKDQQVVQEMGNFRASAAAAQAANVASLEALKDATEKALATLQVSAEGAIMQIQGEFKKSEANLGAVTAGAATKFADLESRLEDMREKAGGKYTELQQGLEGAVGKINSEVQTLSSHYRDLYSKTEASFQRLEQ